MFVICTIYSESFGSMFFKPDHNQKQFCLRTVPIMSLLGLQQQTPFAVRETAVVVKHNSLLWQYHCVTFCILQNPLRDFRHGITQNHFQYGTYGRLEFTDNLWDLEDHS
jgi:hypothetical protein